METEPATSSSEKEEDDEVADDFTSHELNLTKHDNNVLDDEYDNAIIDADDAMMMAHQCY